MSLSHTCSQPWLHLHAHSSNSHICAFTFKLVHSYSYTHTHAHTLIHTPTYFHILSPFSHLLILTICILSHTYTHSHRLIRRHTYTLTHNHFLTYRCIRTHTLTSTHILTPTWSYTYTHAHTHSAPTKSTCSEWSWVSLCYQVKSKGDPGGSSLWTFNFCSWEENLRHLGCSHFLFVGCSATWCCLDVTLYLLQI